MSTLSKNNILYSTKWDFPLGILFLILGIITLSVPVFFHAQMDIVLPWVFIVTGIFRFIYGIATFRESDFAMNCTLALVNLSVGINLQRSYIREHLSLCAIIGVFLVAEGISKLLIASGNQSLWTGGFFLFSGIVGLCLGSFVWAGILTDVPWLLSAVIGIRVMHMGFSNLSMALTNVFRDTA